MSDTTPLIRSDDITFCTTPPRAIIFDLLTGLLDSWTLWDSCATSTPLGRAWRANYLRITFSQGPYAPYPTLVALAASQTPGLPPTAATDLISRWDELAPWLEVPWVLRQLRSSEHGYRLGVYTNCSVDLGRRAAERACENNESTPAAEAFNFDQVLTAEEVGFYKPDPRAYAAIIEALGVKASECLFVAGSAGDVVGATRAGMKVVWHNKAGLEPQKGEDGEVVKPLAEGTDLEAMLREVGVP